MANTTEQKLKKSMSNQGNSFNDCIKITFHQDYSCPDSGCHDEGICRCVKIYDAQITDINFMLLTNRFYRDSSSELSKQRQRNDKLNDLLYGGERIDKYCINRILTHHKAYRKELYSINIISGYYGDEISTIYLRGDIYDKIYDDCSKVLGFDNLKDKIQFVLTLEYGFVPEHLLDKDYVLIYLSKDQIDFTLTNLNHLSNIHAKSHQLTYYHFNNYTLPRGIVRKVGDKYTIVDGFHRILADPTITKFDCFCVID